MDKKIIELSRNPQTQEESFQGCIVNIMPKLSQGVDYLRNYGQEADVVKKANSDYLPEKLRIPSIYANGSMVLQNMPFPLGNIIVASAINRAIRELGIKDLKLVSPTDVMEFLRKPNSDQDWFTSDIALVIYGLKGQNDKYAESLMKSANLSENDLPAVVYGLESEINSEFEHGANLVFTADSGVIKNAKALTYNNLNANYFKTSTDLSFEDIVKVGYQKQGSLEIVLPTSVNYRGVKLISLKGTSSISTWFDYLANLHGAGRILVKRISDKTAQN